MTQQLATQRSYGVEIECFLPGASNPTDAAVTALTSVGLVVRTSRDYRATNTTDWLVKPDGSVNDGTSRRSGLEVNSPILRGADDLVTLAKATQALADTGFEVNATCGLHVHLGVGKSIYESVYGIADVPEDFYNLTEGSDTYVQVREAQRNEFDVVRTLPSLWLVFERVFDAMVTPNRRKNASAYAPSLAYASGQDYWSPEYADEKMMQLAALTHSFDYYDARAFQSIRQVFGRGGSDMDRAKVNLMTIDRHSTVEFRGMSGTMNAGLIVQWVRLLHEVFRWAESGQSPALRWYSGELALTALWRTLGSVPLDMRNFWRTRIRALGYLTTPSH